MNILTVRDMAARLGVSERRVRQIASLRKVGQQLPDNTWLFEESDTPRLRPGKAGRPRSQTR